jgi:hypothetical protein
MFRFHAKFLTQKLTTTTPDTPTGDAAKTTTITNHLQSRLMQQRRPVSGLRQAGRCGS